MTVKKQQQTAQPSQDNSWHERGEFPPVGCECEVKEEGEWHETHIVGFDDDGYCVYTTPWNSIVRDYEGDADQSSFRPLRAEREKAVDEMVEVAMKSETLGNYTITGDVLRVVSERLYDKGYRKVK